MICINFIPCHDHLQVKFLQGTDGNVPWVWVMGEHKDDLSYEELVSYHDHCMTATYTVTHKGLMILLDIYYRFVGVRRRRWRRRDRVSWS